MEYTCIDGILMYDRLVPTYAKVIAILFALSGLPSIVLNFVILISIWKTPSLHKPSYFLIASLALSDFLIGITVQPLAFAIGVSTLGKGWNEPLCIIWKTGRGLTYVFAAVSLCTLAAISLDRLLAITLRNRYRNVVTLKRASVSLMLFWIGSLIVLSPFFLTLTDQTFVHVYLFLSVAAFILVSFIAICYSMAFYQLKKLASSVSPNAGNDEGTSGNSSKMDVSKYRKSLKTTFLVFVVIMFFYTPYAVLNGIGITEQTDNTNLKSEKEKQLKTLIYMLMVTSELIVVSNSFVNPIMYLWRMSDIRMAVKTVTVSKILNPQQQS